MGSRDITKSIMVCSKLLIFKLIIVVYLKLSPFIRPW